MTLIWFILPRMIIYIGPMRLKPAWRSCDSIRKLMRSVSLIMRSITGAVLDRLSERALTFAGRQWRRLIASTHSFMMRRQSLVEDLPTFLHHTSAGDLAAWLALTKLRVFNPWAMIRGWGDGKYIPGSIGIVLALPCIAIFLTGRKYLLYSPKPTLATHMETKSARIGLAATDGSGDAFVWFPATRPPTV